MCCYSFFQDVKISEDNILSDIISDLDANTPSNVVKSTQPITKTNIVETSKRDAQNYFKSLSANVKKPSVLKTFKEEKEACIIFSFVSTY